MSSLAKEVHEMQERKATRWVKVKPWSEIKRIGEMHDDGSVEPPVAGEWFMSEMSELCGELVKIDSAGYVNLNDWILSPWMYEELDSASSTPEPPPQKNQHRPVYESLIEAIQERACFGLDKYGTHLQPFNGRNALNDALQESLDMNFYLMQKVVELEEQLESVKKICREIGGE